MNVLYLTSIISLIIVLLLIKKTDKKENFLFWLFLSNIIILCYNIFECYILSLIKIECSLIVLTIVNFIIAILVILMSRKENNIQKYYVKWQNVLVTILIFISVVLVTYKRYGENLDLKYESSDPATHYIAAKCFYKNKTLLINVENEDRLYHFGSFMPAAYVNTGILFGVASGIISESQFYQIYIIFDIIILLLGAEMFYFLITKNEEKIFLKIVGFIFTLLYAFAYPLNSMLFGFAYLSVSLVVIEGVIAIAPLIISKEYTRKYILTMAFLLIFSVFFSYYLFMPIIYVALGLYLLIDMIKNKKNINLFSFKNISTIGIVLILPTIMGFCYFILPGLLKGEGTHIQSIGNEGYIYRNLYSNFILIGPMILYYIIDKIRKKENDFINLYMILSIVFIFIMLVGVIKGKVSTYYFYKIYYAFWILVQISVYKAIREMYKNKEMRIFIYSYLVILLGITLYSIMKIDDKLKSKNEQLNANDLARQISNIYPANQDYINNTKAYYSNTQKNMIKYCEDNNIFKEKENMAVCASNLQQRWIYAIYGVTDVNETREFALILKTFDIENWLNSNKQYYLCMGDIENEKIDKNQVEYKILYQESDCILLKRN